MMSDNNNNNNEGSSGGQRSGGRGFSGRGNHGGRGAGAGRGQQNQRSAGRGNRQNRGSNKSTQRNKGATEELGYHVFNCTTRKDIEGCNETIKQIKTYVGKEFGKGADLITYIIEHNEEPVREEPEDIPSNEQSNKLKFFKWSEAMKRYLDKEERYQADKKKLYNLVWGQCTEMMKNELEIVKEYDEMKKKQDPLMLL